MWRVLIGVLLGLLIAAPSALTFRTSKPPTVTEWTPSTIAELNIFLDRIWQLTNGRYTHDIVTSNPDGSRRGDAGDFVVYNNSGSRKFCTSTGGTTWLCSANALTSP